MPVFDSEVSLEVGVKEGRELVLQILSGPTLGKREVLIMRKQAEVLLQNVFEIVQHREKGVDLVSIDSCLSDSLVALLWLAALFLISFLQVFLGLDRYKLVLQLVLKAVRDRLQTSTELVKRLLLVLNPVRVLLKLTIQKRRVLFLLVSNNLLHLEENWIVLLVECSLVESEVLVVQD